MSHSVEASTLFAASLALHHRQLPHQLTDSPIAPDRGRRVAGGGNPTCRNRWTRCHTSRVACPSRTRPSHSLFLNGPLDLAEGSWAGFGLSAVASCTHERLDCAQDRRIPIDETRTRPSTAAVPAYVHRRRTCLAWPPRRAHGASGQPGAFAERVDNPPTLPKIQTFRGSRRANGGAKRTPQERQEFGSRKLFIFNIFEWRTGGGFEPDWGTSTL